MQSPFTLNSCVLTVKAKEHSKIYFCRRIRGLDVDSRKQVRQSAKRGNQGFKRQEQPEKQARKPDTISLEAVTLPGSPENA